MPRSGNSSPNFYLLSSHRRIIARSVRKLRHGIGADFVTVVGFVLGQILVQNNVRGNVASIAADLPLISEESRPVG